MIAPRTVALPSRSPSVRVPTSEGSSFWRERLVLHEAPKGFTRCQPTPLRRARPKTGSREAGKTLCAVRRPHTWRPNSRAPRLTAAPSRSPPRRAPPRVQALSERLASQVTESEPMVSTDPTQPITESTSSRLSLITSRLASSEESTFQPSPASLNGR
jgi:hypothetical protein